MVSLIKDEAQLGLNVRTASMSDASQCVPTPMRITMVISSLGGGGAERVMSAMAKYWVESGRKVTLITLAETGGDFLCASSRGQTSSTRTYGELPEPRRRRTEQCPKSVAITERNPSLQTGCCFKFRRQNERYRVGRHAGPMHSGCRI